MQQKHIELALMSPKNHKFISAQDIDREYLRNVGPICKTRQGNTG